MTGKEYQELAMRTCGTDRSQEKDLTAAALGLSGESGEFADHVKKWLFHSHDLDRNHLIKELGDVMWYVALACEALDITVDDVMATNISKLEHRYPQGFDSQRSIHREA